MRRKNLAANLFIGMCVAAFAAVMIAAPSAVGRDVTLAEASTVEGAACGGPATTMSTYCSLVCKLFCTYNSCAACGCPTSCDPGTGIYNATSTPCGTAGCGSQYFWSGTCGGS